MSDHHGYLLDNQSVEAGQRLRALSAVFDCTTFRHFDDLGVKPGWRCWEVGAGGPSVVQWLSCRVGPEGRVLATDIDLSWVLDAAEPNVELRRHDVAKEDPPDESFDLVHARLVLVHLADREKALRSMIQTVKPGGVILIEDADPALQPLGCLDVQGPDEHLANKLRVGFRELLLQRGVDLAYGRKLPRLLRGCGLTNVGADAYFPVSMPACAHLELATVSLVRKALVAQELATDEEIDAHLDNVRAGRVDLATSPLISCWGHKT
jgi:SAM-dependent methyltransferase